MAASSVTGSVGVGITVAHDSLHGSGRAEPPHPALASGNNATATQDILAARRTRSSALGAPARHCVRGAFCGLRFPLASPLPSISSAAGCPALFGDFSGTMGLSDFLCPFIVGVRPWTSRPVPPLY